jgi:glutathione synthase/RimK-type ligase-like ATP-grasp enzyme
MSTFFGITREPVFSPGKVDDDAAILELVAARLRQAGHTVAVCDPDAARWPEPADGTLVFAMCQSDRALARLEEWHRRGLRIINSPAAIRNCRRRQTLAAFRGAQIPFPDSVLLETGAQAVVPAWVAQGGAWVKRGDVHATEPADVVAVEDVAATRQALRRMRDRGIETAVVQRHVPGSVLKFYAVDRRFFHGVPAPGNPISREVLQRADELGRRAARALGVEIYGGDCVCDVNGALTLIDLNDWPSYAPCRARAAEEIAAHLQAQCVARVG